MVLKMLNCQFAINGLIYCSVFLPFLYFAITVLQFFSFLLSNFGEICCRWMNGQHLKALPLDKLVKLIGERWKNTGILVDSEGSFVEVRLISWLTPRTDFVSMKINYGLHCYISFYLRSGISLNSLLC